IKNPTIENTPRIRSSYTAQIQTSDTPLRQEFGKSDISTSFLRSSTGNSNSILQTEIRAAHGDPDDPLLNYQYRPKNFNFTTRPVSFPQQLDPHYHHQLQNNANKDPKSSGSPRVKAASPLPDSNKNGYKPKGLIICLCFSIVAGIIFTCM
ncbi:6264_t:CDS:1, partial [Dentiscutata erythropus]